MQSKIIDVIGTTDGGRVTLTVPKNSLNSLFKLKDELCDVDIKKHSNKRSLDANNYMWVLCRDLARDLSKESPTTSFEVYRLMLRRYSSWWDVIWISENMFNFLKSEEEKKNAIYRVVDDLERKDGKVKAKVWLGSSKFNSEEMSRVIDGIVQECKDRDIDTMPPDELERMLKAWH